MAANPRRQGTNPCARSNPSRYAGRDHGSAAPARPSTGWAVRACERRRDNSHYKADRLGPVRPPLEPIGKVPKVFLQLLAVMPPRLAVHARRRVPLATEVGRVKRLEVIDVVQERREPHLPVPACCLPYPLQRTGRALPAQKIGRVLLLQVPLGQTSSLRPLRHRLPGVVRRLHRYYRPVRLPVPVHRRRTSLDFPTRPAVSPSASEHGTSRFSCEVFPYVLGVSDRAGPCRISRYRCNGYSLPVTSTASASRRKVVSRLNTQPARAPVNASMPPSQAAPHDSGPGWVARPSPYDSFIHDPSPVYPGAQKFNHADSRGRHPPGSISHCLQRNGAVGSGNAAP